MSKTFNNKSSVIIFLILFIIKMCLCEEDKCITSTSPKYEEYFMEHEVTQKEAKIVFDQFKDELLNSPAKAWCNCTQKILNYCLGQAMLKDHCCCDQRHGRDFSWIPHTCYVGKTPCKPYFGSCLQYKEHKECCCDKALAQQFKDIYSAASFKSASLLWILSTIFLIYKYKSHIKL